MIKYREFYFVSNELNVVSFSNNFDTPHSMKRELIANAIICKWGSPVSESCKQDNNESIVHFFVSIHPRNR